MVENLPANAGDTESRRKEREEKTMTWAKAEEPGGACMLGAEGAEELVGGEEEVAKEAQKEWLVS